MVNPHYLLVELNVLRLKSLGNETAMNSILSLSFSPPPAPDTNLIMLYKDIKCLLGGVVVFHAY